jgi:signal transduction histidine kinase/CheY-like chemotaxis protein
VDILGLVVLFLFGLVFLGAVGEYVQRRDPVSRGVALVFSPFVVLFFSSLWRQLAGPVPGVLSLAGGALLLAQPVLALHLVSLVRQVSRWILVGSAVLIAATTLPLVVIRGLPTQLALLPLGAFVVVELLAGGYLLGEARRRSGPGAVRLTIAALSTGLFGATLLVVSAGVLGPDAQTVASGIGVVLALAAGCGYLVAFLPPRRVQEVWQATSTVAYGRALLGRSAEPPEAIWQGFTDFAAGVSGAMCFVVLPAGEAAKVLARTGLAPDDLPEAVSRADVDGLLAISASGRELAPERAGPFAIRLAERTGAGFVSVVPLASPDAGLVPVLVIVARHRSLFRASDLELLAALGGQTAVVAERRTVLAEQEALTERLAATVEALRSASQAKSDFLASMSHELRTPLSAILGFSELMRGEESHGDSVLVPLEWVEHIHTGGEHLLALINDVLDLAKVEAGRLELTVEPLDLDTAVAEVVNGIRPLADRKGLRLTAAPTGLVVRADRGRFRQILYNLLSNAIKYTPDDGAVAVEAGQDRDELWVAVVDTGIGIATEDQATVFDEFRQVGDDVGRSGGTGLGLALTKRLVEAHGGRIAIESAPGQGSRFTVHLASAAVARADAAAVAPATRRGPVRHEAASAGSGEGSEVLVIEDDPSALRLLREYLEPVGYVVRSAPDGEAGLAEARRRTPAAVILDVLLPRLDGWEVLRRLKGDEALRDVPVIIVTVVDEREVGLALGAVDYLVKPVGREALLATLDRLGQTSPSRTERVRVLAVDDEPAAVALIRAALEPEGFEVVEALGGREALARARMEPIDLVICDLVMPDIDGFEVIGELKRDERTADIPILVCTAHELSNEDKARLNGQIMGIVAKGSDAREGLREWLGRFTPALGDQGGARAASDDHAA